MILRKEEANYVEKNSSFSIHSPAVKSPRVPKSAYYGRSILSMVPLNRGKLSDPNLLYSAGTHTKMSDGDRT